YFMFGFISVNIFCFFFFFSSRRRHTRFDCDWSSDVCSSDLKDVPTVAQSTGTETPENADWVSRYADDVIAESERRAPGKPVVVRSEERRVGKECRSRGWP